MTVKNAATKVDSKENVYKNRNCLAEREGVNDRRTNLLSCDIHVSVKNKKIAAEMFCFFGSRRLIFLSYLGSSTPGQTRSSPKERHLLK